MKKTGSLLARLGLKNEPRLKIFSVLYDKKCTWCINKVKAGQK